MAAVVFGQTATVILMGRAEKSERRRILAARDVILLARLSGDPEGFDDLAAYAAGLEMDLSEIQM